MLMVVVFPAPFGPSKPKISPDSTVMSNLSTAVSPLNDRVNWLVSIICVIDSVALPAIGRKANLRVFPLKIRKILENSENFEAL
jgi:hypothetical protein